MARPTAKSQKSTKTARMQAKPLRISPQTRTPTLTIFAHKIIFKAMEERIKSMDRSQLIAWLCWNDPNGVYTDKDSENDGLPPITLAEAREIAIKQIKENDHVLSN